jgi:hypothetical protein
MILRALMIRHVPLIFYKVMRHGAHVKLHQRCVCFCTLLGWLLAWLFALGALLIDCN